MLRHLRVTNFAILSDVEIELGPGMNVLTGETGAGKSLIVEAVNLLRGGRASADIPRTGTDEAVVEAIVEVPADLRDRVIAVLEGAGLPGLGSQGAASHGGPSPGLAQGSGHGSGQGSGHGSGHGSGQGSSRDEDRECDAVFIRRVIQRGGRSRTYVNGALTTAARLAELGALLVDLSGQHQHQGLVDPSRHRDLLDAFGAAEPLVEAMSAAWAELRRCDDALAALGGDEREREARIDYLRYQLEELDAAAFASGEDQMIEIERVRLASVDLLQGAARAAEDALYGSDDSARDRVAAAAREVERGMRTDATLEPLAKQLSEIETLIDDAADQLRSYADKLEGDPERLAYLDERIALIRRLVRKHAAANLDEILVKATQLRAELDALTGRDATLADVLAMRTKAEAAAMSAAAALTASRKKAARKLEKEVGAALVELGMGSARLQVSIETLDAIEISDPSSSFSSNGANRSSSSSNGASSTASGSSISSATGGPKTPTPNGAPKSSPPTGAAKAKGTPLRRGLGPHGADRVELVLASNKGEDARPLTKIASGGELSRIMLALKLGLQSAGRADHVATYVFDEVDAGIGGATAQVVGSQIRAVAGDRGTGARGRQVLCVTHLPQIAAFADQHFHVEKAEVAGRTETRVKKLTVAARKDELARMLGGQATSKAKAHAAELLAEAARPRKSASARV
ncbi:MAG: DNA repair protein RecN [Kofleriaceae bacterium]